MTVIKEYKLKETGETVEVELLYDLKGNVFYYSYKCKLWEESGFTQGWENFNKENELLN